MSFDDDINPISQPDPKLRLLAIIPVVIIAGALLAFMYGFRTEGRTYTTAAWRAHTVAEHAFTITTPGTLMSMSTTMNFDGESATAQVYVGSDMGTDFSVTVAERPTGDKRAVEDVAKSLGVKDVKVVPGIGAAKSVETDFIIEGQKTRARLVFKERMLYQLMVVGPAKTFPEQNAERFFASFKLAAS